jgi:hypothetical protein
MVSGLAGWRPRPGMTSFLDFLTPSQAGIQARNTRTVALDSRFRGNDDFFSLSRRLIVKYRLFADLEDVLGEDHLLAADPRGVAGRG